MGQTSPKKSVGDALPEVTNGAEARATETSNEMVFLSISEMIFNGQLKPGQVVTEVGLATQLNVSRGPVREAMNRLIGLNQIEKQAYSRARISPLSIRTVVEIFQLREAVEGLTARLVAENAPEEVIEQLIADFQAAEGRDAAFDVHIRLAEACGNDYVRRLFCNDLYYQCRRYRRLSGEQPGRSSTARQEHWQILRAVQRRDGELAESLMRTHIRRATDSLSQMLAPVPKTSSNPEKSQ